MKSIKLPLECFQIQEMDGDMLYVYGWLKYLQTLDVRKISILSGMNIRKVSAAVARLENMDWIVVDRKTRRVICPTVSPSSAVSRLEYSLSKIQLKERIKEVNRKIKSDM